MDTLFCICDFLYFGFSYFATLISILANCAIDHCLAYKQYLCFVYTVIPLLLLLLLFSLIVIHQCSLFLIYENCLCQHAMYNFGFLIFLLLLSSYNSIYTIYKLYIMFLPIEDQHYYYLVVFDILFIFIYPEYIYVYGEFVFLMEERWP